MRKRIILSSLAALVVLVGAWMFFANGKIAEQPLNDAQRKILDIQDERLTKGNTSAPVKIVEYADILCPYCAKANEEIIPQIQSSYIDNDQAHYEVRLVAMLTPDSQRAAEGAYCAAEQGMFWHYLDTAYKYSWDNYYSQNKTPQDVTLFTEDNIASFAGRVGLDQVGWQQCMDNGTYTKTIAQNQQKMKEIEAYGTPHFIINGKNYNGAPPFQVFKAVIDGELNKAKAEQ